MGLAYYRVVKNEEGNFAASTAVYFNIFSAEPHSTAEPFSWVSWSPSINLNPVRSEWGVYIILTRLPL